MAKKKRVNPSRKGERVGGFHSGYTLSLQTVIGGTRYQGRLDKGKMPKHLIHDPELVEHLPLYVYYPSDDVDAIKSLIDLIYAKSLESFEREQIRCPDHKFGCEDFFSWIRSISGIKFDDVSGLLRLPAGISKRIPFTRHEGLTFTVIQTTLILTDQSQYMEVVFDSDIGILSRFHWNRLTNAYIMLDHYPVAYKALDASPELPWEFFDLDPEVVDPYKRIGNISRATISNKRLGYQSPSDSVESDNVKTSTGNKQDHKRYGRSG